jgi:hypothetical protein
MLKRIARSYGANATETLTAGALHRRKGGAQSPQQGGARENYDGALPANASPRLAFKL